MKKILIGFLALSASLTFAGSLNSETNVGSTSIGESLSYSGSQKDLKKDDDVKKLSKSEAPSGAYGWSLGYGYLRSKSDEVIDVTHSVDGGLSYKTENKWNFGLGLEYSTTPEESLISLGPNLNIGYSIEFSKAPKKAKKGDKASDDESSDFVPGIDLGMRVAYIAYTQKGVDSQTVATAPAPSKQKGKKKAGNVGGATLQPGASNRIQQRSIGFTADLNFIEDVSFNLGYTKYKYSRDINGFLDYLNSPLAARQGVSGFSSTVSGFPDSSLSLGPTVEFLEFYEIDVTATITKIAADGSRDTSLKAMLSREIGDHFKLGLGFDRTKPQNSSSSNTGYFNVGYSF